jgi:hypothetical protein
MLKKSLLFVIVIAFTSSFIFAGPGLTPEQKSRIMRVQSKVVVVGDAVIGLKESKKSLGIKFSTPSKTGEVSDFMSTSWINSVSISQINTTDAFNQYDLISNGTPSSIAQNPDNPGNIHAVYMWDNVGDDVATSPNRLSKYWLSTDFGTTWSFVSDVPSTRSGYSAISFLNGVEVIANHGVSGGGSTRTQVFLDSFEGFGAWILLDHEARVGEQTIWPRLLATSSITNTYKYLLASSISSTDYDSSFTCAGTSLTSPGTFTPWLSYNGSTAETYKMAKGDDGRIGFIWVANSEDNSPTYTDLYFQESTDNGTTFSAPTLIFDANYSTDSLGAFRGLDIVYLNNSPKVVFETVKQTRAGNYYGGFPNNIRFWSPTLPGSDPNRSVIIVDTSLVGYHPAISQGGGTHNDALSCMCRCGIGLSGSVMFVSFMVPFGVGSGQVFVGGAPDTNSFNAIWLTASGDGGSSWKSPQMITPFDTTVTMRDWTFPSISKWNDTSGTNYYANISVLQDSVPGSYYAHSGNGYAVSKFMFIRVSIPGPVFVNNISTAIPGEYSLYQNYPNPFNPTTNIRFALPKASNVTLKIYNVTGQLVETLLRNERVTAGVNEVSFNASRLSSGIYFYTIQADNFKQSRKMMLVK